MGKDLNGKELGKGMLQEQNGKYMARFTDWRGKRRSKRFDTWAECKEWIADARFMDENCNLAYPDDIILDTWYDHWKESKRITIKASTLGNYVRAYDKHIKGFLGKVQVRNIRPIHCQEVLNQMALDGYSQGTIGSVKKVLNLLLESAFQNDIIKSNPCKKGVKANIGKEPKSREALTQDEQNLFLEEAVGSVYYDDLRFILQTGVRVGELRGIHWSDIDWKNKTVRIQRSVGFNSDTGEWEITTPKTRAGTRIIPLTQTAIEILKQQKIKHSFIKVIPFEWAETVFLNSNGHPNHTTGYNNNLELLCEKIGLRKISVHILRHTFATRCIEGNMKPKTLQKILGHANIVTTMNLYVHMTDDEKKKEMNLVAGLLGVI